MPRPARIGWITTNHRRAAPQDMVENSTVGIRYIQPDCGSAAKGRPPMTYGFHVGSDPCTRLVPR